LTPLRFLSAIGPWRMLYFWQISMHSGVTLILPDEIFHPVLFQCDSQFLNICQSTSRCLWYCILEFSTKSVIYFLLCFRRLRLDNNPFSNLIFLAATVFYPTISSCVVYVLFSRYLILSSNTSTSSMSILCVLLET
jgi:hypothetical protein